MEHEGPPLELLLQRLANAPPEFLAEPKRGKKGTVNVAAVVADLGCLLEAPLDPSAIDRTLEDASRNALSTSLLLCWLFAAPWFRSGAYPKTGLLSALTEGAKELAAHTASVRFLEDVERREEMVRFALARVSLRPEGETKAQAEDRLTSLSAAERARVLKASREAEQRARAIREALARKAAEESADKWTRE